MSHTQQGSLKRSLTMPDLFGLGINGIIGSGIFLLPSKIAGSLGPAALIAILLAGILSFLIALCFAEVSSRFSETGGPFLYAQKTLGPFAGFEVGWMHWWSCMASWAALAVAFATALANLIPGYGEFSASSQTLIRHSSVIFILVVVTVINYVGAKQGAILSNLFTVAKLLPLFVFVLVGIFFVEGKNFTPFAPHGLGGLGEGTLVILYAYVGFESLVVPAGEMKNPQRNLPIALLLCLGFVTLLYLAIQIVSSGTLTNLASESMPVAASASTFLGASGGKMISVGILLSIIGVVASMALVVPRCVFGLAENGLMPRFFAYIHPKYSVPTVALILSAIITCGFALSGSFKELVVIAVVARFVQYIATCVAVFIIHKKDEEEHKGFKLPFARVIATVAIILSLLLISQANPKHILAGLLAAVSGIPFYFWFRRTPASS